MVLLDFVAGFFIGEAGVRDDQEESHKKFK